MTSFALGEDERMLKDTASRFVTDKMSTRMLRALRDRPSLKGLDRTAWVEMASMGWTGIAVSETCGGSGLGVRALAAVIEQLGRMLVPVPMVSTALVAATVLERFAPADTAARWLASISAGTCVAALAVDETAQHSRQSPRTGVGCGVRGLTLTGTKRYVADGLVADLLLVSATAGERVVMALVRANSPGVTLQAVTSIDSRGMADIRFDEARVEALLTEVHGRSPLGFALDCACIGLAAEMLGASSHAFEMTLEYLRTRRQFGRPIGSFQALQHRAARLYIELELTRSCVAAAADALHHDHENVPQLASLAKASAAQTMRAIAYEAIQLHGGIGMTDAHDAGLYLKRGRVAALLYGDADFHTDRYAALRGY